MKAKLFDGNTNKTAESKDINSFAPNREFEKKFNERKKREEVERLKNKLGPEVFNRVNEEDAESSSSLSEDEDGMLDDEEMNLEFIRTLTKLKTKHPDIYKQDTKFFDVDVEEAAKKNLNQTSREKKVTVKDVFIENLKKGEIDPSSEEEDQKQASKKITPMQKQNELKNEFLRAAGMAEENGNEQEFDNLLVKKAKTDSEAKQETEDFDKFLEKNSKKIKRDEVDLVKQFWSDQNTKEIDENEKFLKEYILKKKWIDRGINNPIAQEVDEEDEQLDEKVDEFEEKYNFRFEEENAHKLTSYSRKVEDTVRGETSKRKEIREKEKQKKEEKMDKLKGEIDFLKQAKKDKIMERIMQLKKISGISNPEFDRLIKEAIDGDFDVNYDRLMETIFNDQYYDAPENEEDQIKHYLKTIEQEFDNDESDEEMENRTSKDRNKDQIDFDMVTREKEEGLIPKPSIPIHMKHNINDQEAEALKASLQAIWWYCDICLQGIKPLESRFDCLTCPDHSECKNCAQARSHEHKLKKFIVPEGCIPPSNEEIQKLVGRFKFCEQCNEKIMEGDGYYQNKTNSSLFICGGCIVYLGPGMKLRDFTEIKPQNRSDKGDKKIVASGADETLNDLLNEYRNLDFEDVIAGNIKTRYEYIDVSPEGFGLTDAELMFADDKLLNQMISIKKLAPYKDGNLSAKDREKIRKLRTLVKESAERNQKRFLKETELLRQEEELKQKAKKSEKAKKEYDAFMAEKEERLAKIYSQDDRILNKVTKNQKKTDASEVQTEEVPKTSLPIAKNRLESYGLNK